MRLVNWRVFLVQRVKAFLQDELTFELDFEYPTPGPPVQKTESKGLWKLPQRRFFHISHSPDDHSYWRLAVPNSRC